MISILGVSGPRQKLNHSFMIFKPLMLMFRRSALFSLIFISSYAFSSDWIYTVRKGDTLWDLCSTYTHVVNCWLKIGEYNGVEYPKIMAPGTRIKFPVTWLKSPPTTVKVLYARGDVDKVWSSGESKPLLKGMELAIGDSVRTGENSTSTLLFADDSILILEESSYITMDSLSLARDETMVDSKVNLSRGSASARVPKPFNSKTPSDKQSKNTRTRKPNIQRRFEIQTPSAVAAVRGTEFRVSARGEEGAEMAGEVYAGEIRVSQQIKQKNTEKALLKKYGIVVEKDREMGNPIELLSAPAIQTSGSIQYEQLSLSWDELSGATKYVLSLFPSSERDNLLKKVEVNDSHYRFDDLDLGCYQIALRAIDVFGLQGLVTVREFCLVPVPDPPKARIDHDKDYNGSVLSWLSAPDTNEYQVEFSNSESFSSIDKAVPAYCLEYSITMVEKRDYAYVRVRSKVSDSILGRPSSVFHTKE